MQIGLASRRKSVNGHMVKLQNQKQSATITLKPERDGLFCEKSLGQQRDLECSCGKLKKINNKGKVCDRCGVEVTRSKVRREHMEHRISSSGITCGTSKRNSNRMGLVLNMESTCVGRVIYFASYVVMTLATQR